MAPQEQDLPDPLPPRNNASAREEVSLRADSVWAESGRSGQVTSSASGKTVDLRGRGGRVAVVDGCRTPFAKAGGLLKTMNVVDLAAVPARELVARSQIDPNQIDLSIFGVVLPALEASNLGREVVLRCGLPSSIPGTTVSLACASSNRAIAFAVQSILSGESEVVLAGGAESLSNLPVSYSHNAVQRLREFGKADSVKARLSVLGKLRLKDLAPEVPAIAEYSTGMTMGEACEKMAKENDVSRQAQDEIALLSHQRAVAARDSGAFDQQIVPTAPPPRYRDLVGEDNGLRPDTSLEALSVLPPVLDSDFGSLTAGNSSPLTDGASAVLLMSEEKARSLGFEPLGFIRSFAFASVDPAAQLLQGPAYAAPLALERAGLALADMDLVEMHEAFAAQIISNLKAFASPKFARQELGRSAPLGEVDLERFNVTGGSIAIGHPFGATGARVTFQILYELRRRQLNLGLLTVCAAGGVGFAMVVERS
ncbi:MAG: acetyl-CoA C-acyltransferase [Deltaproteobacteria bacterium]|nr:acetyl-CoA C-acyltransferase [Deltaproteobacteria bacterium]